MKKLICLSWLTMAVCPWLLVYAFLPDKSIDLTCQSSYELVKAAGDQGGIRSYGTMISYYHPDGTGIVRYTGILLVEKNAENSARFSVHRANNFNYELIGSFVKMTSQKAAKYIDDNADDSMVGEYVYPGFNADSAEYFKFLQMGNGAVAAGIGAMPRIYCEPLTSSSASR